MTKMSRQQEFRESLENFSATQLEGMMIEYCSRDRYLYSIKKLGFQPKTKWFSDLILVKQLEDLFMD